MDSYEGWELDAALQKKVLQVAEALRSQKKVEKLLEFLKWWQETSLMMNGDNCLDEGISSPEVNSLTEVSPSLELATPHSNIWQRKVPFRPSNKFLMYCFFFC